MTPKFTASSQPGTQTLDLHYLHHLQLHPDKTPSDLLIVARKCKGSSQGFAPNMSLPGITAPSEESLLALPLRRPTLPMEPAAPEGQGVATKAMRKMRTDTEQELARARHLTVCNSQN